jgi:hypothetical protein
VYGQGTSGGSSSFSAGAGGGGGSGFPNGGGGGQRGGTSITDTGGGGGGGGGTSYIHAPATTLIDFYIVGGCAYKSSDTSSCDGKVTITWGTAESPSLAYLQTSSLKTLVSSDGLPVGVADGTAPVELTLQVQRPGGGSASAAARKKRFRTLATETVTPRPDAHTEVKLNLNRADRRHLRDRRLVRVKVIAIQGERREEQVLDLR